MTATIERPQAPESFSRVRHGVSYWFVALVAVLGLGIGTAVGYWWGDSETDGATSEVQDLTENQETALSTIDEMISALNTSDIEAVKGFYVDDFGWNEPDPQAYADEYFGSLEALQTAGYEFESTETAVLGEPFGVMVDVGQILTATHPDQPTVTLVTWYRTDPQTGTILEASVSLH
jgi:hypothetical protein